jgi:zinc protease
MQLAATALFLALFGPTAPPQEEPAVPARPWEHETSDLPVNPRVAFGRLPNGLRYAWMKNSEPRERCYLRLHVDVGALAEEDAEDGLAHFLEHMAFNGSEHFPAGTLVEWFQKHGMAFGADLNASTSYSQTVYSLDLPSSDEELLREGLGVMRDWAGGLLLSAGEIDKEKGVIDAEQASGDTANRRVFERILAEQYAGTRYVLRDVIGERGVRAAFTADGLRSFYQRWYRPELMTLIIVGDLGQLDPEPLVAAAFGDLAPPAAPVPSEPSLGRPALEQRFFSIFEPELPTATVHLERLALYVEEPDTRATRTKDLDLDAARGLLNQRFAELVKQAGTPFLSAGVGKAGGLEVYEGETLTVTSVPERWEEAFDAAELELRRALAFGFRQAELDELRANWLRAFDEGVEREPTRHSGAFVNQLVAAAEERFVPIDAESHRALLRPVLAKLTVEACQAALVEAWGKGVVNLYTTGDLDLGEGAGEVLKAAYERAGARPVEKGGEEELAAFAYASSPDEAGKIASERRVEDLDAWLFTFENGVRLNVKATDFKEREILVQARLAEGLLTVAPADFAVAWAGPQAFNFAGLGKHSVDELRELLAGKRAGVSFGLSNDAFHLSGATTAEDLLLELELLRAALADPGWRDDGIRLLRDRVPPFFEQLSHVPDGPLYLEFLPALFHGDPRFSGLPSRAAIEAVNMAAVRAWLAPHLADGPLEVTIVGDLDVEAVKAAAARTLGILPKRRALEPHAERRKVPPPEPGIRMERAIETEDDKAFVQLVFPTADGLATERRRSLNMLAAVVQDRLRLKVREELGAAYSPGASASPSETFPGIGILSITASVPPEEARAFADASLALARELAEKGVTADELARLAEPILAQIRDAQRTNGYWARGLAEAQSRPATLDDVRSLEGFYRALDPARLSALAKESLDAEKASLLLVTPAGAAAPAPAEAAAGDGKEEDPR